MNSANIRKALAPYGATPSDVACDQINTYIDLLLRWNKKVALTTVYDPSEILTFHFGESVFAGRACGIVAGRLGDVGSGAGFPGLPLKILYPDLTVTLIESVNKKATFLAEVIRELGLKDTSVFRGRMEDYSLLERAEFVTARAFGQFQSLLPWSRSALNENGKVALWLGADDASHLSQLKDWQWAPPVNIPNSERRCILVGEPL